MRINNREEFYDFLEKNKEKIIFPDNVTTHLVNEEDCTWFYFITSDDDKDNVNILKINPNIILSFESVIAKMRLEQLKNMAEDIIADDQYKIQNKTLN